MNQIHPTALVSESAQLDGDNKIGPFVVIEEDVILGKSNCLGAHSLIKKGVRIGDGNIIHEHGLIGVISYDCLREKMVSVSIGSHNVLREGVWIEGGSGSGVETFIGDHNYLMAYAQVGRNCRLADNIVIANNVVLAEQVQVESQVFISGGVVVGEHNYLGRLAMLGGNSKITKNVLPFCITDGVPARVRGLNLVGLRRADFKSLERQQLKQAYRVLLRSELPLPEATERLGRIQSPHVRYLSEFIKSCKGEFHC